MFTTEYQITDKAALEMCLFICRKDRNESQYFTTCLETYINAGVKLAGAHSVTIRNKKDGKLAMLAGVGPCPPFEGEGLNPEHGVAWILKTSNLKVRTKDERKAMVKVLADCLQKVKDETPYKKIGNAIHSEQTASLTWMQKAGFTISWDNPGVFFNHKGKQGYFYQFSKEI